MTEKQSFDIAVIGGGPGGYVAAIKAAQLKKKVCIIEENFLGGTCLNVGCIPTKTLLANADIMHAVKAAEQFGIVTGPVSFDFRKMKQRKDGVVEKIRKSLEGLLRSNGIVIFRGRGEFLSSREIKVKGDTNLIVEATSTIIATGSAPLEISAFPCDHKRIFNSTSILELETLPKKLAIIGGGYIGCEFASLYAELGVEVVILEALPSILSLQGKTISEAITRAFFAKGIKIHTKAFVQSIEQGSEGLKIHLQEQTPIACDAALVAVGRKIASEGIGLEKIGIQISDKGAIPVNEKMETGIPGIYAIGDVTGKFLLAHVASHQGIVAGTNAAGGEASMHYNAVPAVIFTLPEVATVGMTLEEAVSKGYAAIASKYPFQALGKAVAAAETEGFVNLITDKKTGQILGAEIVGHGASNLIAEMALAIANELTVESIIETIHAHPTMPEAWLEAALIANDTPIHFPPKIKGSL